MCLLYNLIIVVKSRIQEGDIMKNTIDVVIAKSFSNKYFYCALLLLSVAPYAQAQQDNFTSPTRSNDAVKNKSRVGMQKCFESINANQWYV